MVILLQDIYIVRIVKNEFYPSNVYLVFTVLKENENKNTYYNILFNSEFQRKKLIEE